jgi:hypothetical protein
MAESNEGDSMRSLLAELATGALAGDERARVLEHLAACAACRQELAELTRAADALLMFAPRVEPPPGFESRVLAALDTELDATAGTTPDTGPAPRSTRRHGGLHEAEGRRRRGTRGHRAARLLTAVAVAATALVSGAAVTHWRDQGDRSLAERYRKTLAVADGDFLTAGRLRTAGGARAGTAFLYQGNPSWLVVTVTGALADGRYEMFVVDRGGAPHSAGYCLIKGHTGTAGYRLPIPVGSVAAIRLRPAGKSDLGDFDLSAGDFNAGY